MGEGEHREGSGLIPNLICFDIDFCFCFFRGGGKLIFFQVYTIPVLYNRQLLLLFYVTSLLLERAAKFTEHVFHIINAFEQGRILITQHMHRSCDQEPRHCHLKTWVGDRRATVPYVRNPLINSNDIFSHG